MGIFHFYWKDDNLPKANCPLLLGNFDGVHKGHQALISAALEKGEGAVLLLNPPFYKDKTEGVLTTLEDKIRLFQNYGIKTIYVLKTDEEFFSLSKEDFVRKILKKMEPSLLVVGEDYSFGSQGKGKVCDLKRFYSTLSIPLSEINGQKIGTRLIKSLLLSGCLQEATNLLGRPYEIKGMVKRGFQNGRKISFPTANLEQLPYFLPKKGVYCGLSYLRGICYKAIINVGDAPTVGKLKENIVEVYLDGFEGDCYGETLYVDFMSFIREETHFASLEDLKNQLQKDLEEMRKKL